MSLETYICSITTPETRGSLTTRLLKVSAENLDEVYKLLDLYMTANTRHSVNSSGDVFRRSDRVKLKLASVEIKEFSTLLEIPEKMSNSVQVTPF